MSKYLFAVFPQKCENSCSCYYNDQYVANVYNCSKKSLHLLPMDNLPGNGPRDTNWMCIKNAGLLSLLHVPYYLNKLKFLDVSNNLIANITHAFIDDLTKIPITWLDLSSNRLRSISRQFMSISTLKVLILKDNIFLCSCELAHMYEWMSNISRIEVDEHIPSKVAPGLLETEVCIENDLAPNTTNIHGMEHDLVLPKKSYINAIVCRPVRPTSDAGSQVHIPKLMITMIGISIGILGLLIVFSLVVRKKLGLDKTKNDDIDEDIERMNFDAFVSYW